MRRLLVVLSIAVLAACSLAWSPPWGRHHYGGAGGAAGSAAGTSGSAGTAGSSAGAGGAAGAGGSFGLCGNGTVDPLEACDGSNLVNSTCTTLGFTGGSLACSSSCQFDVSSCTGAAITPTVVASRTSCKAPCSVFFDATTTTGLAGGTGGAGGIAGGDYVQANWTWDFNDPTSAHKGTIGFVAAHVFDNPGTYHVTTRVQDLAGNAGTATTTVTVSAMSGTTYYVASNGNDSHGGTSIATAWLTFAHAIAAGASTNNSILFRRGDTFNTGASDTTLAVTGPFWIGSFSDPGAPSVVAPVLNSTDSGGAVFQLSSGSDMRFTDLHIVGGGAFSIFNITAPTSLFERVEIEGYTSGGGNGWFSNTDIANTTIADCNAHDFAGYGLYATRSQGLALLGTSIHSFTTDHAFRLQGGSPFDGSQGHYTNNSYVAENNINVPSTNSFSAGGLFRGENTNSVYVNNTNNRNVAWTPQDITFVEHVSLGLAEGNIWNRSDFDNNMQCIAIVAQNIVMRNNLCTNATLFSKIDGGNNLPAGWTTRIFYYNNTLYLNQSFSFPMWIGDIGTQTSIAVGTITFKNNVHWTTSTGNQSGIYFDFNSLGTEVTDHNDMYAPNAGTLSAPNVGTGGILTDPKFVTNGSDFHLQASSPCKDTGTNTHTYQSYGENPGRPQNSSWDMGAYEVKNP